LLGVLNAIDAGWPSEVCTVLLSQGAGSCYLVN
jgi:hypothetical protein